MTEPVVIDSAGLVCDMTVPADATGMVIIAHDSADCRRRPGVESVTRTLQDHRFATLVVDLLQPDEQRNADLDLLTQRLIDSTDVVAEHTRTQHLPMTLFGAGTAVAAALMAAAAMPHRVHAVLSRDGHPELAGERLEQVLSPVLLMVGEHDTERLRSNQQAGARLGGRHQLRIIPRAQRLFEQACTLEAVAVLAGVWLMQELATQSSRKAAGR